MVATRVGKYLEIILRSGTQILGCSVKVMPIIRSENGLVYHPPAPSLRPSDFYIRHHSGALRIMMIMMMMIQVNRRKLLTALRTKIIDDEATEEKMQNI